MDYVIIIISVVIGIFGMVAGGIYWSKLKAIIKQIGIVFDLIIAAIEDDQITREELDIIVKEAKILFELFKGNKTEESLKTKIAEIKSKKKKIIKK